MLGRREPNLYGSDSLDEISRWTDEKVKRKVTTVWFQSNIEGEIVERIQSMPEEGFDALVINPGGYSHTSVAILDAMKILEIPIIEVHLSQIYKREEFRHTLLTAKAASAIMSGLGKKSYYLAIHSLVD